MKNLIKSLVGAVSAVALSVIPIEAKVDSGTYELIQTVQELGFDVHINSKECKRGHAGLFIPNDEAIHLCKGKGQATADDHDTVRHEVWHLIQYCGTPQTAGALIPYTRSKDLYIERINDALPERTINHVMETYPEHVQIVELEAFAAAADLSAKQIQDILIQECG